MAPSRRAAASGSMQQNYAPSSLQWVWQLHHQGKGMDMKSTRSKPAAKKRRAKHPAIPKFLGTPKGNPYLKRLTIEPVAPPPLPRKLYEPVTWPAVGWSVMVVIGLAIACYTAFKLAELFARC